MKRYHRDIGNNFYIKNGYLCIKIDDYFGFPHVIQAMDVTVTIEISFPELMSYLNPDSILKNLEHSSL